VPGDVDTLFAGLEEGLAGRGLDILVNNAGGGSTGTGLGGTVEQVTGQQLDRVLALNAKAPLFVIQRALPLLRDGGRIINREAPRPSPVSTTR
jgi:3-oxoacyl-[acyl-carrier protein] reductase